MNGRKRMDRNITILLLNKENKNRFHCSYSGQNAFRNGLGNIFCRWFTVAFFNRYIHMGEVDCFATPAHN